MNTATPSTTKPTRVLTGKVRLSYAHLYEPYSSEEGKEKKYSVSLLIRKDDKETLAAINAAVEAAIVEGRAKWGNKLARTALKLPLNDGDIKRPDDEDYAGCYYINASSKQRPSVLLQNKVASFDPRDVYSGCYARVSINFFPFAVSGNNGIAAGLGNVQKWNDGEPLGGRVSAEDEFDELPDDGGLLD